MDLGIYCVYAAVDLFGKPEKIMASAGFLSSGADGYGSAIFIYNDKQVTLTYSKTGQSIIGSEIMGDLGTLKINSISKLTEITLVQTENGKQLCKALIGNIPKSELMSGEAAAFLRFANDPAGNKEEIESVSQLTFTVSEVMETIRKQAGIWFKDDL
ncbi:MAG TPA: hypothetical protein DEP23_06845 [Ruminococcaceae bacterium]|nr:hypothetical protein [Oscillospiraceae bacterium]